MLYRVLLFIVVLILSSCVSVQKQGAPVVDLDAQYAKEKGYYTVSSGETLYSIAWRLDRNYQSLAKINHISPPYKLAVGEKIYLHSHGIKKTKPLLVVKPTKKTVTHKNVPLVKKTTKKSNVVHVKTIKSWTWPTQGKVVDQYSQTNKGINISGKEGQNVFAAASGQVVYAGNGLRAYGNLTIIKHNATYLSAYAHNKDLRVKEGDYIKQGQVIAHLGHTGTTKPMLHFEIRKKGKPVDPLHYLAH